MPVVSMPEILLEEQTTSSCLIDSRILPGDEWERREEQVQNRGL